MMNEQESGVISFDDYVRQKACSVPQHRMKEFLDSLAKGTEILQELSPEDGTYDTTTMVYQQQGTNCIYMDSTELAGSLLELACPVQVTSADILSHLSGHQECEEQLQVQVQIQDQQGQVLQVAPEEEFPPDHLIQQEELPEEHQHQVHQSPSLPLLVSDPVDVTQIRADSRLMQLFTSITGGQQIQLSNCQNIQLQGTRHIQLPRVKEIQIQAGQQIQLEDEQQIQIPVGIQIKAIETAPPSLQQNSLREADTRSAAASTVIQPAKKRKVDVPLSVSYTDPQTQPLTTVLTIPQGQQQGYMSVQPELLTVDSSQLYSTTGTLTGPTGETWTIPVYSTPDQPGVTHITFPMESTVSVATPNGKDRISPTTLSESVEAVQATAVATTEGTPEEIVHTLFPAHFMNGNIHIPLTVQTVGGTYNMMQSLQIWDQSQQQAEEGQEEQLHLQGHVEEEAQAEPPSDFICPPNLNPEEGLEIWKLWAKQKNKELDKQGKKTLAPIGRRQPLRFQEDLISCAVAELNLALSLMTKEAQGANGEQFAPDALYYVFLCLQKYLCENGRVDDIFSDRYYARFCECLHNILDGWKPSVHPLGYIIPSHVTEEMLWDCKQLGAHSPATLLTTLMYFNTKYFCLTTPEQHMKVAFTKVLRHTRKNPLNAKDKETTIRLIKGHSTAQKGVQQKMDDTYVEQVEDRDNPLRCPIKLYDFYLFKCPQSVKGRNDAFYMTPEVVVAPNSTMWYSSQPLTIEQVQQMLARIRVVQEINSMIGRISNSS